MTRPCYKYGDSALKATEAYLDNCVDHEEQRITSESDKASSYEFKLRAKIPTIEGLANHLGIHKDTIYLWEGKYNEFKTLLARLRQEQCERLIQKGLSGDYNSRVVGMMLSKHGYVEEKKTDLTNNGGTFEFVVKTVTPKDDKTN